MLRMFVARALHKKPEARRHALEDWLIRESIYDEFVGEFVRRYASAQGDDVQPIADGLTGPLDVIKDFQIILRRKPVIEELETKVQQSKGDVYVLRDALLAAVKELTTPRRKLGLHGDQKMTEDALAELKKKRQLRLRCVVLECLEGIWRSGVGGEVLKAAMDQVHQLIDRFESRADDVRLASAGSSWHKLKKLVGEIEEERPETRPARKRVTEVEGKNTKTLVEKALADMGGRAATFEILDWIEKHPEVFEENPVKINQKDTKRVGRCTKVWHNTVRNVLTIHFRKSFRKRPDRHYTWAEKHAVDEEVLPTLEDGELALEDGEQDEGKGKKRRGRPKGKAKAKALQDAQPGEPTSAEGGAAASPGKAAKPKAAGNKRLRKTSDAAADGAAEAAAPVAPVEGS